MAEKHFTGLRAKMLVVVAAGMVLLFTILFTVARTVLLEGYAKLESNKTLIQVNSVVTLLNEQSQQLEGIVSEYAHWDDTYQYMVQPDARYIDSNYTNETFSHLKVKAIMLINPEGVAVYKRGFDFTNDKPWPIPKSRDQAVSKGGIFLDTSKDHMAGFFWTPEGVCIVTAMDIQPSASKGISHGTLIMVRHVDQALIEHIENVIGAKFTMQQWLNGKKIDVEKKLEIRGEVVKP